MKYLFLVILLITVITVGCTNENKNVVVTPTQTTLPSSEIIQPTTVKVQDFKTFKDFESIYEIKYPIDWNIKRVNLREIVGDYRVFGFASPDNLTYIEVGYASFGGGMDYKSNSEWLDANIVVAAKVRKNFNEISQGDTTLDSKKSKYFEYSFIEDSTDILYKEKRMCAVLDDGRIVLSVTAPAEKYDRAKVTFEKMLESFKFDKNLTEEYTSENKIIVATTTRTTAQIPLTTLTRTTAPTTAVSTLSQTYKTADLVLALNTNPMYGFKIDYPSEWTFKRETNRGWRYGFNFSSPDEKSNVYIYIDDTAGEGAYWYPLDQITQNSMGSTSWANNVIKSWMKTYCLDGAGYPGECSSSAFGNSYYHRRLINNESVTLSGNVKSRKLVFAPDSRDTYAKENTNLHTIYLMQVGKMQGYNFTVPDHPEVAVEVDGPMWDFGIGGQAYAIYIKTPYYQVDATKDIFDHMIKSFEVTIK